MPALARALTVTAAASTLPTLSMPAPAVSGISPNNGAASGGTRVTISGSGFVPGMAVRFGATDAGEATVRSPTSILAVSPPGAGTVAITVGAPDGSAEVPRDQFAYDPAPSEPWLGLNGNASTYLGPVERFVRAGVAYNRSGPIELIAGTPLLAHGRPTEAALALDGDIRDGMIPAVTIEFHGYDGEPSSRPYFPTEASGSHTLAEYVSGFVATAAAIRAAHPGVPVLFEAINEPWLYTTPRYDPTQYANVIAKLLPAAQAAGIPAADIYVAAYGRHWVARMYAARPSLETEVQGWYLHPYGPPAGSAGEDSEGIQSLPAVQAEMTSGQSNIVVSEIGFCALDVEEGRSCGGPSYAHSSEAAAALSETLVNALPYHQAGWLRALIVYSRNAGGWAMQLPGGALTAQGTVLEQFAEGLKPRVYAPAPSAAEARYARCAASLADAIVLGATLRVDDGMSCG